MSTDASKGQTGRELGGQIIRFGLLGLANTGLTGLVYLLLSFVMPLPAAYSISWCLGLGIVALFTPRFVFRVEGLNVKGRLAVGVVYLVAFALGFAVTWILDAQDLPRLVVVLASLATSSGTSFVGSRLIIGRGLK